MRAKKMSLIKLIFISIVFAGFYTVFIERYLVTFPRYEIYLKDLPPAFDGFRVLQISDLHYGKLMPAFWVEYLIKKCNEQNPDIIAGTGDYVHAKNTTKELESVWPILRRLKAAQGVYFVNGNHDHWAGDSRSMQLLEESGFSVRHRNQRIQIGAESIVIAGAGDYYEDKPGFNEAMRGVLPHDFVVMLAHNPDTADLPHDRRVNLYVTGHTHGGQVRIPLLELSPVLPVKNKKYDMGLKKNAKGESIFISKGIGWAILPVRFYVRPEIPVLVLRSGSPPQTKTGKK